MKMETVGHVVMFRPETDKEKILLKTIVHRDTWFLNAVPVSLAVAHQFWEDCKKQLT